MMRATGAKLRMLASLSSLALDFDAERDDLAPPSLVSPSAPPPPPRAECDGDGDDEGEGEGDGMTSDACYSSGTIATKRQRLQVAGGRRSL